MDEKVSAKQPKDGKQKKARPSKKTEREPERLREQNDITITILSEIANILKKKSFIITARIFLYPAQEFKVMFSCPSIPILK